MVARPSTREEREAFQQLRVDFARGYGAAVARAYLLAISADAAIAARERRDAWRLALTVAAATVLGFVVLVRGAELGWFS